MMLVKCLSVDNHHRLFENRNNSKIDKMHKRRQKKIQIQIQIQKYINSLNFEFDLLNRENTVTN